MARALDNLELDCIIEDDTYCEKLCKGLDAENVTIRQEVYKLLATLCKYSPKGLAKVLEILERFKVFHQYKYRFDPLINELKKNHIPERCLVYLIDFINSIIDATEDIAERTRVRNEFIGLRLLVYIDRIKEQNFQHESLMKQIHLFYNHMALDDHQKSPYNDIDINCPLDVFYGILKQVSGTPQEVIFLSVLQHLLLVALNKRTLTDATGPNTQSFTTVNDEGLPNCEILTWEYIEKAVYSASLIATKAEGQKLLIKLSQAQNNAFEPKPGDTNGINNMDFKPGNGSKAVRIRKNGGCICCCHDTQVEFIGPQTNVAAIVNQSPTLAPPPPPPPPPLSCRTISKGASIDSPLHFGNNKSPIITVTKSPPPESHLVDERSPPNATSLGVGSKIYENYTTDSPPSRIAVKTSTLTPPDKLMLGGEQALPQQKTPTPKSKLKTVNWIRIPLMKVLSNTNRNVWTLNKKKNLGQQYDIDFAYLEELFMMQHHNSNGTISCGDRGENYGRRSDGLNGTIDSRKRENNEVLLLDAKRNLNVSIFLKQFKSGYKELLDNLESGNAAKIGTEKLRGLLKVLPEPYEIEILQSYTGDFNRLGIAEKFLKQLIALPNYQLTIEGLLLKEDFMNNLDEILPTLDMIIYTAQDIQNCTKLHEMLLLTVFVGNFINSGGYAGNAAGIKLSSLLKIAEIRGNNPKIGLLHFVAQELRKHNINPSSLLVELKYLENVQKVNMDVLLSDISSIITKCGNLSSQVSKAVGSLKKTLEEFLKYAKQEMDGIQDDLVAIEKWRTTLADFFCEERSTFKLEECFRIFYNFLNKLKKAEEENIMRKQMEEKSKMYKHRLYNSSINLHNTKNKETIKRTMKEEFEDTRSSETSSLFTEQDNDSLRSGSPGSYKKKVGKSPVPSSSEDLMDYLTHTSEDIQDLHNCLRRDRRSHVQVKGVDVRKQIRNEEGNRLNENVRFQREIVVAEPFKGDKDAISLPSLSNNNSSKKGQHERQLSLPDGDYKSNQPSINYSPTSVSERCPRKQCYKRENADEKIPMSGTYGQLRKHREYVSTYSNGQRDSGFIEHTTPDEGVDGLDNTICAPQEPTVGHGSTILDTNLTLSVSQLFASIEVAEVRQNNKSTRDRLNSSTPSQSIKYETGKGSNSFDTKVVSYPSKLYPNSDSASMNLSSQASQILEPSTRSPYKISLLNSTHGLEGNQENDAESLTIYDSNSFIEDNHKYDSVTWKNKLHMLKDKYNNMDDNEENTKLNEKGIEKSFFDSLAKGNNGTTQDFYKQVLLDRERRNQQTGANVIKPESSDSPNTKTNASRNRKLEMEKKSKIAKQSTSSRREPIKRPTFSNVISKNIHNNSSILYNHSSQSIHDLNAKDERKNDRKEQLNKKDYTNKSFKKEVAITITFDKVDKSNSLIKSVKTKVGNSSTRYSDLNSVIAAKKNGSTPSNLNLSKKIITRALPKSSDTVASNDSLSTIASNMGKLADRNSKPLCLKSNAQPKTFVNNSSLLKKNEPLLNHKMDVNPNSTIRVGPHKSVKSKCGENYRKSTHLPITAK